MSELKPCPFCGAENTDVGFIAHTDDCYLMRRYIGASSRKELGIAWNTRPIEDELRAELARRDEELKITDGLLKEATETIGAVVACCTYNSNDDAKIGIYGIDQKAFTMIDQFITHYNDAVFAGKVSVDVKRELSDAEINELGAQEAERKEFCPNCEAETPCTHEAELYVCDICGEDFAKYIVSRNCNVSDVSTTQDVLTDVKTPPSIENTNPDYYKQELARLNAERRWIPVSERLPDDPNYPHTEPVLVLHGDYECTKGWYEKYDNPEECIFLTDNNHEIYDVTHWMPLPEPPEER